MFCEDTPIRPKQRGLKKLFVRCYTKFLLRTFPQAWREIELQVVPLENQMSLRNISHTLQRFPHLYLRYGDDVEGWTQYISGSSGV
jgi:hypothetical protein